MTYRDVTLDHRIQFAGHKKFRFRHVSIDGVYPNSKNIRELASDFRNAIRQQNFRLVILSSFLSYVCFIQIIIDPYHNFNAWVERKKERFVLDLLAFQQKTITKCSVRAELCSYGRPNVRLKLKLLQCVQLPYKFFSFCSDRAEGIRILHLVEVVECTRNQLLNESAHLCVQESRKTRTSTTTTLTLILTNQDGEARKGKMA